MENSLEKQNETCNVDITTHIYPLIRKRLTKCIDNLDITLFEDEWEASEKYYGNKRTFE